MLAKKTVICPGCGGIFSLDAIQERPKGDCPDCGFTNHRMPNRLLTVDEILSSRAALFDGVNLSAFLRSYRSLIAQ